MSEEYIYKIGKYTIGVGKGEDDDLSLSIVILENGKLYLLGSYHGEIVNCVNLIIKQNNQAKIDLNYFKSCSNRLFEENKKLKEQQKEFINYLKSMLENEKDNFSVARVKDVLEKYKEIVGDK